MRWLRSLGLLVLGGCVQSIAVLDAGPSARGVDGGASKTDAGGLDATTTDAGHPTSCSSAGGASVAVPSPAGPGSFRNIRAIQFDIRGNLFVLSRDASGAIRGFITELTPAPDHRFTRVIGEGVLTDVADFDRDLAGNFYVVEDPRAGDVKVNIFDRTGTFDTSWTLDSMVQDTAISLAVDANNRVNIGDLVVSRYTADGTPIDFVGGWGVTTGRIGRSNDIAFDANGMMWIADVHRNRIHQFDPTTKSQVLEIGQRSGNSGFDEGAPDNERWGPTRLALDAAGNIYANDPFASRIVKLAPNGRFIGEFDFGGPTDVWAIAVNPSDGNVYVGQGTFLHIICPL